MVQDEKVNILIVDDKEKNLLALESVLTSPKYKLTRARSGEEALKKLLIEEFALVLMDVQMPGLNGFETAKMIKVRDKSKHIPIIFLTAISKATEHVVQGYSVGAVDYLFKPFNPETLRLKVESFVQIHLEHQKSKLQRESDIRLSEKRFAKIFNSNPELMAIITVKEGRFIDVNKSFLSHTGYTRQEIIGRNIEELNLLDEKQGKYFEKRYQGQEAITNERLNYQTKAGEHRVGLISTEVIDIGGEKCILSVTKDITEMERVEKEMVRLDRLDLIGEMAAGIGHEIRNPLTTVRGFLQLLSKKECGEINGYYTLMIEELDRANSIITEYLSLASNKRTEVELQSLNNIVKAILPLITADAIKSNKYVITELGEIPELPLDAKEIRQIIFNLARNGLEAMSDGGNLTISTYREKDQAILAITDQGSGIAPEILEKIGTPFFTTKDEGTGLGLAICHSIASRHNADITVDTSSEGTSFMVRFNIEK